MEINGLGISFNTKKAQAEKVEDKKSDVAKTTEATIQNKANVDKFVKSNDTPSVTYKPTAAKVDAEKLQQMEDERTASFTNMLTQMLGKQGKKANDFFDILATAQNPAAAEEDSFDNDPVWGVDAVATRIMDMAKALSGGDKEKLEMLREAVQKGFGAAQKEWGNQKMPPITSKTYDEVMKRFDAWAAE